MSQTRVLLLEDDQAFFDVLRQKSDVVILMDNDGLAKLPKTGQIKVLKRIGRTYAVRFVVK